MRLTLAAVGFAIAAGLSAFAGVGHAQPAAPRVTISSGALAGVRDGGVVSFKGVPFATPPVGKLRWRPPQPVKPWRSVRAADKHGPLCQQKYNEVAEGLDAFKLARDGLAAHVQVAFDAPGPGLRIFAQAEGLA